MRQRSGRRGRARHRRHPRDQPGQHGRHAESTVEITSSATDRQLRITVDDDGTGVAEADRERIFERFVRVDDARTRAAGGSGLGLALVASIVDDHGGTTWCETSPSLGGARFVIELPVSSPDDR